jgi:putative acetyltransferase
MKFWPVINEFYHMERYQKIPYNDQLIELWESSVRATHDFLLEEDINFYKSNLNKYFDAVDIYLIRNNNNKIAAFMGISEDNIEMLFVHPNDMGQGIGTSLVEFAINELKIKKVDVNEQNKRAFRFYEKMGFHVVNRSALDNEGRPYPILHLVIG